MLSFIIKKQASISQEVHRSKHSLYHFAIIWLLALHDHIYVIRKAWESSIDITSDVLEVANGGASKIEIMYKALLSYNQMKVYVNFLNEKGLLVYDNQHGEAHTFRTTEKGLRFLEIYNRLDDMIKEDEGEQVPPLPSLIKSEKKMTGFGR
jgi:predicted transcriptional regulator